MKLLLLLFQLLFTFYYAYVIYVFYKLQQNTCECSKLEGFKKTWNFRYVSVVAPLFFVYSLFNLMKIVQSQKGGGMYHNVLAIISLGFLASFVNDYAIINLFHTMEKDNCPCQTKNRKTLNRITYGKAAINLFFYLRIISVLDKKKFNALKKRIERNQKNKIKRRNDKTIKRIKG